MQNQGLVTTESMDSSEKLQIYSNNIILKLEIWSDQISDMDQINMGHTNWTTHQDITTVLLKHCYKVFTWQGKCPVWTIWMKDTVMTENTGWSEEKIWSMGNMREHRGSGHPNSIFFQVKIPFYMTFTHDISLSITFRLVTECLFEFFVTQLALLKIVQPSLANIPYFFHEFDQYSQNFILFTGMDNLWMNSILFHTMCEPWDMYGQGCIVFILRKPRS